MRALRTIEADGFEIIMSIVNPIVDPMASKVAARDRLGKEARYKDVIAEMVRAPEYFQSVKGQENIGDEEAERLEILMHKAGKFEKVTRTGEIIADNRGRVWYPVRWSLGARRNPYARGHTAGRCGMARGLISITNCDLYMSTKN